MQYREINRGLALAAISFLIAGASCAQSPSEKTALSDGTKSRAVVKQSADGTGGVQVKGDAHAKEEYAAPSHQDKPSRASSSAKNQVIPAIHDTESKETNDIAKDDLEQQSRMAVAAERMVYLTVGIIAVSFIQIWMFWRQLRLMHREMDETQGSAEAAKDSAKAAVENVEIVKRQQRAWVSCCPVDVKCAAGCMFAVQSNVCNFGQSPAFFLESYTVIELASLSEGVYDKFPNIDSAPPESVVTLFPKECRHIWAERMFSWDELDKILDGELEIFILSVVRYRDAFYNGDTKDIRYTRSCARIVSDSLRPAISAMRKNNPPVSGKADFRHTSYHNDAT